jgi:hypothetical protein
MTGVVMFLRLKNGDDIVTECYEYDSDYGKYYVLINPLKAVYMSSQHGRTFLQVAFMPWVYSKITRHQEFSIYASEVLLYEEVSDYMEEYYWNSMEVIHKDEEPPSEKSRLDQLKEALEELGLDGDLNPTEKKVFH